MVEFSPKIMTSDLKKVNDVGGAVSAVSYATKMMWKHPLELMFPDSRIVK
jgi:hypothetical protein